MSTTIMDKSFGTVEDFTIERVASTGKFVVFGNDAGDSMTVAQLRQVARIATAAADALERERQ